jgi:hypothetical protein
MQGSGSRSGRSGLAGRADHLVQGLPGAPQVGDHAVDAVAFGGEVGDQLRGGVALGRPFLANPDRVERLRLGAPLNPVRDRYFMYVGGAEGYNDYPTLDGRAAPLSSDAMVALEGARVAWRSRATSSAAPSTRTAFCQVSLARSVVDQPRSSSSASRFG